MHEACDGFNLAVFSRHATHMSVLLFDLSDTEPSETIELDPRYNRTGDIWLTPRMARCARAFRPGRRTAIGQKRSLTILLTLVRAAHLSQYRLDPLSGLRFLTILALEGTLQPCQGAVKRRDGLISTRPAPSAGIGLQACFIVAAYSGRISKRSRPWALRSAVSAAVGLAAREKMNPR